MNKNMGQFILKIIVLMIIIFILTITFLLTFTQVPTAKFRTSYNYEINTKYNKLLKTNEPKIILIGGSNLAFGIDEYIIEKKTGMPVINMGLHAGFSAYFNTEIAKGNIGEGDIVVLAYEYDTINNIYNYSPEVIVSGIDNNLKLYKYVPIKYWKGIIKYIPTYVIKKINALMEDEKTVGVYSIYGFDENGNMSYERKKSILPDKIMDYYGKVVLKDENNLPIEAVNYVNDFYNYCKGQGANVLITFPSILDERFYATDEQIKSYEKDVDEKLSATRISNIKDYIFTREYMYDTIYHLNSRGDNIRSERLANDIIKYLNKEGVK